MFEVFWTLLGGQRQKVFSEKFNFEPVTIFPSHRKMRLPKGDSRSQLVKYSDYVQMHSICRYVEQLDNQPVIIEVGAYQGVYATIMGRILKKTGGKLIALEPDPINYKVLISNIRRNGMEKTVFYENVAVMDMPGTVRIDNKESQSMVLTGEQDTNTVRCVTLEYIIDKYDIESVDLLLIDTEGAELPVLRGIPWERIEINKIFCELHPYNWRNFGYSGEELKHFLISHDFRCFDMYFLEYREFLQTRYIGPTLFVKKNPQLLGK